MYDFKVVESEILDFWKKNNIYPRLKRRKCKKKFNFLDGPPYTTGAIHIGHAWNKTLKDCVLRYKRMCGFEVSDTPGYDMHGLPIEVQVEKKLGINNKQEIINKIGLKRFIRECEKFSLDQLWPMSRDFTRLGIWMDWDRPYMTINNSYIEGAWWALKRAWKNGFLYKGHKAMTWCARCATALAKHELVYETVKDNSVFVKFKVRGKENEYLLIWTSTPWTLSFNLGVMVNPDLEYVKIKTEGEYWIIARALATAVVGGVFGKKFDVVDKFKGEKLEGISYEHPFSEELQILKKFVSAKKAFTVVLSSEYVDASAGTGLVHMAPACGPEDYEIGKRNGIPTDYNEVDEHGIFSSKMGRFSGFCARKDDRKFIDELDRMGILLAKTEIEHEYAHCWRCNTPVIYRATEQWFLAVEKLKGGMLDENKKTLWIPDWAGNRWFVSWLNDLQDWCISRQRFWGIPLPIWECEKCGNITIVENNKELERLSGAKLDNLHRPWIDDVKIKCKCGSMTSRVSDVLDVWLDSGAAAWASFEGDFAKSGNADFILEGKDQIRGWFNSLMCLSMVARGKTSYNAVYMHGMIMDAYGRKMSKSLKNVISPYEVIEKYGADTLRYYMIGAAKPGLDMNYNFEDMKVKHRNLDILCNLSRFIIELAEQNNFSSKTKPGRLDIEEKYILSKLHSSILTATELCDSYNLDRVPGVIEGLFLELSRAYIQFVRDKAAVGSLDDKKKVFYASFNVFFETLKMFSVISPFLCEKLYLDFRGRFKLKEESISFYSWSKCNKKLINNDIVVSVDAAKKIIEAGMSIRDREKINVRWPLSRLDFQANSQKHAKSAKLALKIIKNQLNVKDVKISVSKKNLASKVEGVQTQYGVVSLDTELTKELEEEGYARELIRRVQTLRKKAGMKKQDEIELFIAADVDLKKWSKNIRERCSAKTLKFEMGKNLGHSESGNIRGKDFFVGFNIV